jgi:hypothetical protein
MNDGEAGRMHACTGRQHGRMPGNRHALFCLAESGNGMARPRPALSLRAAAEEALRKAQGACDAHISEDA